MQVNDRRLVQIEDRVGELRDAYSTATLEWRNALEKAQDEIERQFAPRLKPIQDELQALSIERSNIENAAVEEKARNHPLVGRKVSAMRKPLAGGWYDPDTEVFGIIEVITATSEQPRRRRLPIGTLAVRRLGSNGKPVKTVERLYYLRGSEEAKEAAKNQRLSNPDSDRLWQLED